VYSASLTFKIHACHIIVTTAMTNLNRSESAGIHLIAGFIAQTTSITNGNGSQCAFAGYIALTTCITNGNLVSIRSIAGTGANTTALANSPCHTVAGQRTDARSAADLGRVVAGSRLITLGATRTILEITGCKLAVFLGKNLLLGEIDTTSPGGGGLVLHTGLPHTAEDTHIGGRLDLEPVQEGAFGALGHGGGAERAGARLTVGDADACGYSSGGEVGCSGDGGDGSRGECETHGIGLVVRL
jgi:hypothetical protein